MTASPEELALELSQATFEAQTRTESKLRETATNILQAGTVVIPVAAIAVSKGPAVVAVPFGLAALSYALCAYACGAALFPRVFGTGIHGSQLLESAADTGATLRQMQASAAGYLDQQHASNATVLETNARNVRAAIILLALELVALATSLVVTLLGR
jgi:hypothetical protein